MEQKEYLIGEVSEIAGISRDTLRFYEKKGILSPRKKDNGYRYYTEEDIFNLVWILYNRKSNFSLEELISWKEHKDYDFTYQLKKNLLCKTEEEYAVLTHHQRVLMRLSLIRKDLDSIESSLDQYCIKPFPNAHILKTCPDYRTALTEWYKLSAIPGLDMTYFYNCFSLNGSSASLNKTDLLFYSEAEPSLDPGFSLSPFPKTVSVPCVYTVIKTDSRCPSPKSLLKVREWACASNILTEDYIYSNNMIYRDGDYPSIYYLELYLPIRSHT